MLGGRYRVEDPPIGQGGMGVVYKAFDSVTKRFVALKTLKGDVGPASIELFQKEWSLLAQLSHPHIVDVLDYGDFVENGQRRPYFTMPLLPGATLEALMKAREPRLTPERGIEIVCQACRGLQAAHTRGLIHRDMKPSNLFVMDDDTVKIIDFGIVHLTDAESKTGVKGTLQYMAPEQLDMKPANARSDIFSLGVVCYELLTGRKPFERGTEEEVADAIRCHIPPPVSQLNPAINDQVSRAVRKAMAKQPYHRFSSAREFSEILQRAVRNEHIELFDRSRIQPRINRIKKALNDGDFQLATDILDELESEGNLDPEMSVLRVRTEQAARSRTIYQLIESARTRLEEQEYPLALQNVQRILDLDPANVDALAMKREIDRQRSANQIDKWFQIAQQHFDNKLFAKSRQAIDEILKIDPSNQPAKDLLAATSRGEQELAKLRQEKQQLYDAALKAYRNGEISSALSKLEQVIDLGKRAPGHPNTDAQYLALYEQIRSERDELHNSYVEGKKALESRNFSRALDICQEVLRSRPGEPLFQALKIEIEDLQRQENSVAIARLHSQIEAEADLERKFAIVKDAVRRFPEEQMFSQSLKLIKEKRDLVNSIVSRAQHYESQRQFVEATNQWDILRNIYPQYPGLDFEVQRLARKHIEYGKEEAKASWVDKIDRALFNGDLARAEDLLETALLEAPEDGELIRLKEQVQEASRRQRQARLLLDEGEKLTSAGDHPAAIQKLRAARELGDSDPAICGVLKSVLVEYARALTEQDWRAALPFIEEALEIDAADPEAASVARLVEDVRQREQIDRYLMEIRGLQTSRKLKEALERVEQALNDYPNEIRLSQLRNTLRASLDSHHSGQPEKPEFRFPNAGESQNQLKETLSAHRDKELAVQCPLPGQSSERSSASLHRRPIRAADDSLLDGFSFRTKLVTVIAALILISLGLLFIARRKAAEHPKPVADLRPPVKIQSPDGADASQRTIERATASPIKDAPSEPAPSPSAKPPQSAKVRASVSFHFESTPSPARAVVDNEDRLTCLTPCELPLPHGRHTIRISAPGYDAVQRIVQVPEDTVVFAPLTEELKTVRVISVPSGAALFVDGESKGQTPTTLRLTLGPHKFRIAKDETTTEKTMDVTPETIEVQVTSNTAQ